MLRPVGIVLVVAALVFGIAAPARTGADNDAAANRLLVETVGLVEQAEETESPGDRAAFYERALENLDEIVAQHPGSDLAVRLATGQEIGNLDRSKIERRWRLDAAEHCLTEANRACVLDLRLKIDERIEDSSQRAASRAETAASLAGKGLFGEALETAATIGLGETRAWALGVIAVIQARDGRPAAAREIIAQAFAALDKGKSRPQIRVFALGRIAEAQVAVGDAGRARETFDQALANAISIKAAAARTTALIELAQSQFNGGEDASARRTTMRALKSASDIEDPAARAMPLAMVAGLEARGGDKVLARATMDRVLEVVEATRIWLDGGRTLAEIAGLQAQLGDFDRAHRTAGRISKGSFYRAFALAKIAAQELSDVDEAAAHKTALRSFEAMKGIDDPFKLMKYLYEVSRALPKRR